MNRRLPPLADSIVLIISPVLIMCMVASLVFFLIAAFYHGLYPERLCYITALFVFAAVLIAKIAMEEGRGYASIFSVALGGAVLLAMGRVTPGIVFPFNLALVGLIWWCSDKLTWDCTVVDESKDPSNQGLLQAAGLEGAPNDEELNVDQAEAAPSSNSGEGLVTAAMNNPEPVSECTAICKSPAKLASGPPRPNAQVMMPICWIDE